MAFDTRVPEFTVAATAGLSEEWVFTDSDATAITSLSIYVGGTSTDVDDFTDATQYTAAISGSSNEIATVSSIAIPTGEGSTLLRLVVDGAVQGIGKLVYTDDGTGSSSQSFSLVGTSRTFSISGRTIVSGGGGGGISDGDKGDITVSGSGSTWSIDAGVVTYAKMQDVSASDRLLGRDTAGAGDVEELTPSAVRTMLNVENGATADQSAAEIKTAYESNADTNAYTDAEQTKVGHLTVTQAVDLDTIESRVNALDAAVVLQGSWDASAGTFPGSGSAQAGDSYIVSVGGTVDSIEFTANDRIVAITDNASTATYASNWLKLDYTDAVLSVAGLTGAITDSGLRTAINVENGADVTDATNVDAAGAVMNSDTSTAAMSFVVDEDNMASDSATKVPSQQSTKAYVDDSIAAEPEIGYGLIDTRTGFIDVASVDRQEFTSSGTWTKPDGARHILAILIGGGGGGASGYRNAEGTDRYGGGGGARGQRRVIWFEASELAATEAVTIGAAGSGGAKLTATTGAGNAGTAGGDTTLDTIAGGVTASGGGPGSHAGGLVPGSAGNTGNSRGGTAAITLPTPATGMSLILFGGHEGGGGGGQSRNASNTNIGGNNGGGTDGRSGGSSGTTGATGEAGADGETGAGGGGGAALGSDGSHDGGTGGFPGGGGGGGSYGNTGGGGADTHSGAGGNGAAGYALIYTFR